ncbi:MAG: hypothetical protein BWY78_00160 [Alphaproteobacteria bacterium ADurb.Bin438]|nr:MAG: hypothetical protein BWY78_00160 [Alphaproteobacteria bacterium ADurb.Bin438]
MKFRVLSEKEVENLKKSALNEHKNDAKKFLDEVGFKKDNKDYEEVLSSCTSVFETCSKYGLDKLDKYQISEEGQIKTLSEVREILNSDNYAENLKKFEQELPIKAHKYKEIVDNTMKEGLDLRKDFNPKFPDILKDKDRVYIEVEDMYPVKEYISSYCEELSEFLKPYNKSFEVKDVKGNPRITFNNQEIRPHHNFMQSQKVLEEFKNIEVDGSDKQLFAVLKKGNFSDLKAILRTRKEQAKEGKEFKNEKICRAFDKNELLFYSFANKLKSSMFDDEVSNFMMARVRLDSFYEDIMSKLGFASGMKKSESENADKSVNIIMVSKDAYDIATASAYNAPARTCFHPVGKEVGENKHHVVKTIIEKGGLYMAALDEKLNPVFRSVVASYKNDKGEVIYDVNNPAGRCDLDGRKCFEEITKNLLNDKEVSGVFKRENVADLFEHQGLAEAAAGIPLKVPTITKLDENKEFDFKELSKILGNEVVDENQVSKVKSFKLKKDDRQDEIDVKIKFPKSLEVERDFCLKDNSKTKALPNNLKVGGDFEISNCKNITSLPENLNVEGNIKIDNCENLKYIPTNIPENKIKGLSFEEVMVLKENYKNNQNFQMAKRAKFGNNSK